ncbi:MAG: FAD-dependent oxidoreductase [Bacteroidetes bacterium]|nr:FAD-dependent oxidoreductase [Bacteroidota bacterium]
MITRRSFIKQGSLVAGSLLLSAPYSCTSDSTIPGSLGGPNAKAGHRIRTKTDGKIKEVIQEDIVIVGGGVSGLSAARWLKMNGQSFRLLELEKEAGGNSRSGSNAISAYPLGAHYLPLPNVNNTELLRFLEECNVITGYTNQRPVYNEYYLCFEPKERLYINHHWQEGLIPSEGVSPKDRSEITRFVELMDHYKNLQGADGKMAFEIPVHESSLDPKLLQLDTLSMDQFLTDNKFESPYLRWYVNYCCADDFGSALKDTSAWAGIHYFSSRRGHSENSKFDDVLTWPEGNHWLVKQLSRPSLPYIKTQCVVLNVVLTDKGIDIDFLDLESNELKQIEAKKAIMASPQFVNKHLLHRTASVDYSKFNYAPWLVANLTVSASLQEKRGEPLCWDNVIYGSNSLGYVHAQHQNLTIPKEETVLTYYLPLTGTHCAAARADAEKKNLGEWTDLIFKDLEVVHPKLRSETSRLDAHLWGHGMIRPDPGFIWGEDLRRAATPIDNKVFFAHSDLSGISIFEEAFQSGITAAKQLMKSA